MFYYGIEGADASLRCFSVASLQPCIILTLHSTELLLAKGPNLPYVYAFMHKDTRWYSNGFWCSDGFWEQMDWDVGLIGNKSS